MTPEAIAKAVEIFTEARRSMQVIERLPDDARPATPDEGYAIQSAFIEASGETVVGWKVGATNDAALALFAAKEPFLGPMFSTGVHLSPVNIDASAFHHACLESEFCFRMGSDLPSIGRDHDADSVASAVDAVIPAMEMISPRFTGIPKGDVASAIADCGVGGGIVLGEAVTDWRSLDLVGQAVSFSVDGKQIAEGTGALVMGDPINALVFTANKLASLGLQLKAGDLVTTGTCTGVQFVEKGRRCIANFGSLGQVEATYV